MSTERVPAALEEPDKPTDVGYYTFTHDEVWLLVDSLNAHLDTLETPDIFGQTVSARKLGNRLRELKRSLLKGCP